MAIYKGDFPKDDAIEDKEKFLADTLPSGSGVDCKWEVDDMGKYYRARNSYHCMNDSGYYDGYADFSLIIPKKSPQDFRLHFHGSVSQYKARRYMLRDYLEDTFYYALREVKL